MDGKRLELAAKALIITASIYFIVYAAGGWNKIDQRANIAQGVKRHG